MRLSVGHFDFILVGVLSLLNICAYFLPQIWGIFSYYFLNKLSAPVSLSSPSDTAMIQILIYLMVSHKSLKLYSLFLILFPLRSLKWIIRLDLSSSPLILSTDCSWALQVEFSFPLLYLSIPEFLFGSFL